MDVQDVDAGSGGTVGGKPAARSEHQKAITIADIARETGVSQGAISSLLNGREYGIRVGEKTREKVFRACRELGYVPNDLRAFVRMYPEHGELAVMASSDRVNGATDPFLARVLKGAMGAVNDPSQAVTIARYAITANYIDGPDELPQPVRTGVVSKFICVGSPNISLCQAIGRRGYPMVMIGQEVALPGVTSIVPDYAGASKLATEYLISLGHRHIAILTGPFGTTNHEIIELRSGVRLAFHKAGIEVAPEDLIHGDLSFQTGFDAVDAMWRRDPRPTAFLSLNDSAAAGVLAGALSRGVKVPDQLSLISCGDDTFSECVHPSLTTVHLPAEEIGAVAVKEIERRVALREEGVIQTKKMIFPVRLMKRDSCGPAASRQKHRINGASPGIDA